MLPLLLSLLLTAPPPPQPTLSGAVLWHDVSNVPTQDTLRKLLKIGSNSESTPVEAGGAVALRVPNLGVLGFQAPVAAPQAAERAKTAQRSPAQWLSETPLPPAKSALPFVWTPAPKGGLAAGQHALFEALALVAGQPGAVAITLNEAAVTHPAAFFVDSVQSRAWAPLAVGLALARSERGVTLSSQGLSWLGRPEIDLTSPLSEVGRALNFFYDVVTLLADRVETPHPGEGLTWDGGPTLPFELSRRADGTPRWAIALPAALAAPED